MTSNHSLLTQFYQSIEQQKPIPFLMIMFQMEAYARTYATQEGKRIIEASNIELAPLLQEIAEEMHLSSDSGEPLSHLPQVQSLITALEETHKALLKNVEDSVYQGLYTLILPYIVELRAKSASYAKDEVETCLIALFLSAQNKQRGETITPETAKALEHICSMLSCIEDTYLQQQGSNS